MKERICIVIQRYSNNIVGGSELQCRLWAEHLLVKYDVDVITTCAQSDVTWSNFYDAGIEYINNVKIYRFRTDNDRNNESFSNLRRCLHKV